METIRPNPLAALTWMVSTLLVAAIIISLLLVILINFDTEDPVAADEVEWTAVFTDEAAVLEGPALIRAGLIDLTLVNDTSDLITLAEYRFTDEATWLAELELMAVGEDAPLNPDEVPDALMAVNAPVEPNSQLSRTVSMTRGFYVFDWVTVNEFGVADYVWRIAAIEVVD